MNSIAALFAPAFLLLGWIPDDAPLLVPMALDHTHAEGESKNARSIRAHRNEQSAKLPAWIAFEPLGNDNTVRQVRIERRVIIRISPRRVSPRPSMLTEMRAVQPVAPQLVEKKMNNCIPVADIAGVQPADESHLRLHMRDRRMVSLRLEKGCSTRNFYSGFYVERENDGKICADRDVLHSRTGAKCEIDRFRQLVEAE